MWEVCSAGGRGVGSFWPSSSMFIFFKGGRGAFQEEGDGGAWTPIYSTLVAFIRTSRASDHLAWHQGQRVAATIVGVGVGGLAGVVVADHGCTSRPTHVPPYNISWRWVATVGNVRANGASKWLKHIRTWSKSHYGSIYKYAGLKK